MFPNPSSRRRKAALQTSAVSTAPWFPLSFGVLEFGMSQYREIGLHPQRIVGVSRPFFDGSGSLNITDYNSFSNSGTISVSSLSINYYTISNSGTIAGSSIDIEADDGFSNSGMISGSNLGILAFGFSNTSTGMIVADVSGGSGWINSQSGGFDNEGAISVTNGDTLTIRFIDAPQYGTPDVTNNGTISMGSGGRLILNGYGSLGGTGSMVIQDGGTLEVQSALADTVNFAGVGTLQVDGLNLVTGTLNGLAAGDVIDFAHATLTGAVVNNHTLTVTLVGGQTENFTLAGPLPAGDFVQTEIDGAGGSEVVVTTRSTIVASPASVTANGISDTTLTVTVEDADGNAVANTAVTLSASGSGNTFTPITGTTNANGVFTATLASTVAQTETITATEGSVQETTSVTFVANFPVVTSGQTLTVFSGQTSNSVLVLSGGTLNVRSGGTAIGTTVASGGMARVSGTEVSAMLNGGLEVVSRTGVASGTTVVSGGSQTDLGRTIGTVVAGGAETISKGGTASNPVVSSGGSLAVLNHGVADAAIIYSGGSETISKGGTDLGAQISGGTQVTSGLVSGATIFAGSQMVQSAGIARGTTVSNGGMEIVSSGGATSGTVLKGGQETVLGGGRSCGTVVSNGGYELVSSGGTTAATKISGGTLEVAAGGTASGVVFSSGGTLQLDASSHFASTISGFHLGDATDLQGLAFNPSSSTLTWTQKKSSSGTLTIKEGSQTQSLALVGSYTTANFSATSDGHGGTLITDPPATGSGSDPTNVHGTLDSLMHLGGVISGFDLGDHVDLRSLGFGPSSDTGFWAQATSAATASGMLNVNDGGHTLNLGLLGQYAAAHFGEIAGGHAGTPLTDPSASSNVMQTPLVAHR
jgi:autotransporter passenger strand-loop-strand repeat protein